MIDFDRIIVTRGYELDARMRIGAGTFARYFEFPRWQALRSPATGLSDLFAGGGRLVMRAQDICVLEAVGPTEDLRVTVEVAQVGGTSIRFVQRALRGEQLVAYGIAITVTLGGDRRPTRAPERARALATGADAQIAAMSDPPRAPALSCDVYVRPSDLDILQHVNHSRYLDYVDDVYQHANARSLYGPGLPASPHSIAVEYERETRIDPALGPASKLTAHTWRDDDGTIGFVLLDPLDGARVARAKIRPSHEAPTPAALAARRVGL
jgi:acyl-CoA thioesterase FadM